MRAAADHADSLRRGRRRPRPQFLLALGLILFLFAAAGCNRGGGGDGAAADSSAADSSATNDEPKSEGKVSSVTVAEAIRSDLVLPILAEGTVRARHQAEIHPEIAGRISELAVREGQHVKAGDLLVRLDARDYQVGYEEARSGYLKALGTFTVEEEPGSDWQAGAATPELDGELGPQLDAVRAGAYRAEIAAARTGLAAAAAAVHRAQLNLERCEVRAPFDGVISGLTLSKGEWVTAGEALLTLTDNLNLEALVNVLESDLGALEPGRPALLAFPALGETLQVKVDVVSPVLDTESRSCPTLLRLANRSGRVRPGMFTRAAIAGEIIPDRLLVPREAVLTRDGRPLVFKVEDGLTQWLYVELGPRNEQFVEIKRVLQGGSLEPGDAVVVSDHLTLTHGAKVKIKRTLHPVSPWRLDATP